MTDRHEVDDNDSDTQDDAPENATARRQFLKRAGQVAVTTPAVTLLLAAGNKQANAGFQNPSADNSDRFKDTLSDPEDEPDNDDGLSDAGDGVAE